MLFSDIYFIFKGEEKMKKIFSVLISIVLLAALMLPAFAVQTKAPLRFDNNGKFKIMHVTDTHLEEYNVDDSVWLIGDACDREQPDLVVITGDNVQNSDDANQTKTLIDKLMNTFETRNIPVAVTFGNHDSESGAMSREELMAYYNTFSVSYSVDDGEALSGCGTYNLPVFSSDGQRVKFNVWVFDSGEYDEEGYYGYVKKDQIEWYKATSDALKAANGGEIVYSLAFQHIIVPEIYDALKPAGKTTLFAFEHIINDGEYYMFDPANVNYGTLNETPCPGKQNDGQFDAMTEQGDVMAIFTGHDHTNAFGVHYKGIDITNSLSTRYNGDAFSTQYGYRMLEIDEADTSTYTTRVVHWYDVYGLKDIACANGNKTIAGVAFNGAFQKFFQNLYRTLVEIFTGRTVSYPDCY